MTAPRPEPQTEARLTLPPDLVRRFDVLLDAVGRQGGIHMTAADVREFIDGILTAVAERLAEERLAIEREARAPLMARMREAVEALPMRTNTWWEDGRVVVASEINRDAVLALIDAAPDAAPRPEEPAE